MYSTTANHPTESMADMAIKATPPAGVSIANLAGYQINEILMWATLIYTILMIGHKLMTIWKELKESRCACKAN